MTKEKTDQLVFLDARRLPVRLALLVAVIFALVFAWFSIRWQIGNMLAEYTSTTDPNSRAIAEFSAAMASSDPMSNWFLASSSRDIFSPDKPDGGLEKYEKVVRLAPYDYRWWIELGRAREQAGRVAEAEAAFVRAVELAPTYTFPHWQLGNFYLRQGRADEAFAELKKAADNNIIYRQQVFSIVWDYYDKDPARVEQLAGDSPQVRADLALFYASKERAEDSLRVWNTLTPEEKKQNDRVAKVVAQALFEKKYYRSAVGFAREIGTEPEAQAGSFQNGGFESDIAQSGSYFGWNVLAAEKVDVRPDRSQKQEGNRSLRIKFNGFNGPQYYHVYQIVAVEPTAKYRISFWLRSEELKSAGNPLIEVYNAGDDKLIAASNAFPTGSSDWQEVKLDLVTPPGAEGITVRVGRQFCGTQCPLFGTIWLDNFQISRQQ